MFVVTKEIKDFAKLQSIELEIDDILVVSKSNKRQYQKLIWDFATYIKNVAHPNFEVNSVLSVIMIDADLSKNAIIKIDDRYTSAMVRKSVGLTKSTIAFYDLVFEALKQYLFNKDVKSYHEYFDKEL